MKSSRSRSGFSLIELLVVISILGVLVALMLPSLSQAREAAYSARCLANQRQFMPALYGYANDNKQFLPIGVRAASTATMTANFSGAIAHYTNTIYYTEWDYNNKAYPDQAKYIALASVTRNKRGNHILDCPSENYLNAWGTFTAVSYGWNSGPWGLGTSDYFTAESRRRIRLSEVLAPSNTAATGDWMDRNGYYEYVYHDQFTWVVAESRPQLSMYHMGGGNVLWADGHASHKKRNTMLPEHFDRRF